MDYFSRFSLLWSKADEVEVGGAITGADTVRALTEWKFMFGRSPRVFFSDDGSEFKNDFVEAYEQSENIKHVWSPKDTPESHGLVERRNGIAKVLLEVLQSGYSIAQVSTLRVRDVLLSCMTAKNNMIRDCGFSANGICIGSQFYFGELVNQGITNVKDLIDPEEIAHRYVAQRMKLQQQALEAAAKTQASTEVQELLNSYLRSKKEAELKVGDAIEVTAAKKKKFDFGQVRWRKATIISELGSKVVKVEFPNGKTEDVHRKRIRHALPDDDKLATVEGVSLSTEQELIDHMTQADEEGKDTMKAVQELVKQAQTTPTAPKAKQEVETPERKTRTDNKKKDKQQDITEFKSPEDLTTKTYSSVPRRLRNKKGLESLTVKQLRWLTKYYDLPLKNGGPLLKAQLQDFYDSDGTCEAFLCGSDDLFRCLNGSCTEVEDADCEEGEEVLFVF